MALSIAREIAYDVYVEVIRDQKSPDYLLERKLSNMTRKISRIDRNLAKQLVFGCLRWHQKIAWIVQNISSRPLEKLDPEVLSALVLGSYQIFYMDRIPDRAAVNESVEYVKARGKTSAVSFVNGILRKVARKSAYFPKPNKEEFPVKYLALQYSHPEWIVRRWFASFKYERTEKMLIANNQPPPITIRVNGLQYQSDESHILQNLLIKDERVKSDRRPLRSSLHLESFPPIIKDSLFSKGAFGVQDEGAQLISLLVNPKPEDKILDACCGPAGKLTHMIELAGDKDNKNIRGIDVNERQIERAHDNLERFEFPNSLVSVEDFEEWKPTQDFTPNKILLDAPCSGLGVLRRYPEGKLHKKMTTILKHAKIQRKLIEHALECLPKGGQLIYSVCSFEPEELLDHFEWAQEKYGDGVEVLSPLPHLPNYYKKYVTRRNIFLVLAGNQDGMDGFSGFILQKN